MIKPKFELFRKNQDTLGVIVKNPYIFTKMNRIYKRFSEETKWQKGTETLFWVPEVDLPSLVRILGLKALPNPGSIE